MQMQSLRIVVLPTSRALVKKREKLFIYFSLEFSTKSGVFSSEVKVKIDVVSKLLWDSSKNQIFIIEASRIFINDIQVKQQKR